MTSRLHHEQLLTRDEIVAAPAIPEERACSDQNFGLPTRVYGAMFGLFLSAIGVLALAFRTNMLVIYGVLLAFLIAFFGVSALFVNTSAPARAKALSWAQFRMKGIATATGQTSSREAAVLVLMLPLFVFCFALAIATIAALVR